MNSQVRKINTRQTSNIYLPTANLATYQKDFYESGIKIYNHLPTRITDLSYDKNKSKLVPKRYLLHNSFYSLEEYFNTSLTMICCATIRKVAGSIPASVSGFFIDIKFFRSHYGPGADSASNRNECQQYFLGIKAAGA